MDSSRLLDLLESEFRLLRSASAETSADAQVPTCPGWTVADLAEHTTDVYLRKAAVIREGDTALTWKPDPQNLPPADTLDAGYAAIRRELTTREPSAHASSWYGPEQSIAFWIRRMTQETLIHRVDAELAAGRAVSPIDEELALDGIDEILFRFLVVGSRIWRDQYGDQLDAPDERLLTISAGGAHWSLRATPDGMEAEETTAEAASQGTAAVSGDPVAVLLWLWNRADDSTVTLSGDQDLLDQFHRLSEAGTQ